MNKPDSELNRRDFLKKGTSLATMMALVGGVELRAEDPNPAPAAAAEPELTKIPDLPRLNFGVIGMGQQGRAIVDTLQQYQQQNPDNGPHVIAICDNYKRALARNAEAAPKAQQYEDYNQLLANKDIQAVVVSTPTHLHKDIAIAALKAGKHVYCEAPLAHTVEDAKEIARAGRDSVRYFQAGLQERSHPQRAYLMPFVRSGAGGKPVMARAQWHSWQSWRRPSSNPAQNWRLDGKVSTGLVGELGIHQVDAVTWFWKARPKAVSGFGSILNWDDGRDVADTIQAVFEYPSGANLVYDASIATGFDAEYEMYHGSDATIMIRDNKAWMFKEVEAPLLGWEVYARKDQFYKETGVALVANATKQTALGTKATEDSAYPFSALHYCLENFMINASAINAAIDDYVQLYGDSDQKAMAQQIQQTKQTAFKQHPAANWQDGLDATVIAIKANEAVTKNTKIKFATEWFEV
jgi:predicted dehydrogenase